MTLRATLADARPAGTFADDARPLVASWGVSAVVGAGWVLLVLFGPRQTEPPHLLTEAERQPVAVTLAPEPPVREPELPPTAQTPPPPPAARAAPADQPEEPRPAAPQRRAAPVVTRTPRAPAAPDAAAAFGGAFAAADPGPTAADVRGVLRGVQVGGDRSATADRGKVALATGDDGRGGTPGRGRLGRDAGAAIGTVAASGSVARASVRVSAPRPTAGAPGGATRADAAPLGTAVRSRESQLRFCYTESGLRVDPELAGTVTVAVTLAAGGSVTAAEITARSWSGDGARAAETCILQKVRGWSLPARGTAGTYDFSFSFTR